MKRQNIFYFALLMLLMVFMGIETVWAQEATFNFTGGQQSFVVPPGVTSIHIQAWGAEGASGTAGPAGLGGFAEGDLAVTPGQTLAIFVGGQGSAVQSSLGGGGFNGGGDALSGGNSSNLIRGGGGGASDVRVFRPEFGAGLNERVIVAAGGGGGCGNVEITGGNGGGLLGGDGSPQPGQGGTQNSGGAGSLNPDGCQSGVFGIGGSAVTLTCSGAGGGWYGGGSGCGGGGGSSYIGGVDNGTTTSGEREGNGMIVLTWTPLIVTPIPTLSEWGLIAMAGILGIVGLMVIIRRKVTA